MSPSFDIVASGGLRSLVSDLLRFTVKYYETKNVRGFYYETDYEEHFYETGLQGSTLTQSIMRPTPSNHNPRAFRTQKYIKSMIFAETSLIFVEFRCPEVNKTYYYS